MKMSVLSQLKLVAAKRPAALAPVQVRRNKLCAKLSEQIALATATRDKTTYIAKRLRTFKSEETGEMRTVEITKRVRPWWFTAESGKTVIQLRYGSKVMELGKGKNSVEITASNELIDVLEVLKTAVHTGELDQQIEVASNSVKLRFKK